jgi:hypothetical protein
LTHPLISAQSPNADFSLPGREKSNSGRKLALPETKKTISITYLRISCRYFGNVQQGKFSPCQALSKENGRECCGTALSPRRRHSTILAQIIRADLDAKMAGSPSPGRLYAGRGVFLA